jgi:hypothetical protein
VDDASLYKHIDSELPDPDRARQLIILSAARAPLPAPREGKDPPDPPSEKGMKLLQELKDDVLLLLAERKVDMNVMATDQPGSTANGSVDVRANEQNVNNRARTARFKDEIRTYVHRSVQIPRFADFYYRTTGQRQRTTRGLRSHNFTMLTKKQWRGSWNSGKKPRARVMPSQGKTCEYRSCRSSYKRQATLRSAFWQRIARASTTPTATDGTSFFIKCALKSCILVFILNPRTHRLMNSIPSSTPAFNQPVSQKQI